jgi:hypothetical protein
LAAAAVAGALLAAPRATMAAGGASAVAASDLGSAGGVGAWHSAFSAMSARFATVFLPSHAFKQSLAIGAAVAGRNSGATPGVISFGWNFGGDAPGFGVGRHDLGLRFSNPPSEGLEAQQSFRTLHALETGSTLLPRADIASGAKQAPAGSLHAAVNAAAAPARLRLRRVQIYGPEHRDNEVPPPSSKLASDLSCTDPHAALAAMQKVVGRGLLSLDGVAGPPARRARFAPVARCTLRIEIAFYCRDLCSLTAATLGPALAAIGGVLSRFLVATPQSLHRALGALNGGGLLSHAQLLAEVSSASNAGAPLLSEAALSADALEAARKLFARIVYSYGNGMSQSLGGRASQDSLYSDSARIAPIRRFAEPLAAAFPLLLSTLDTLSVAAGFGRDPCRPYHDGVMRILLGGEAFRLLDHRSLHLAIASLAGEDSTAALVAASGTGSIALASRNILASGVFRERHARGAAAASAGGDFAGSVLDPHWSSRSGFQLHAALLGGGDRAYAARLNAHADAVSLRTPINFVPDAAAAVTTYDRRVGVSLEKAVAAALEARASLLHALLHACAPSSHADAGLQRALDNAMAQLHADSSARLPSLGYTGDMPFSQLLAQRFATSEAPWPPLVRRPDAARGSFHYGDTELRVAAEAILRGVGVRLTVWVIALDISAKAAAARNAIERAFEAAQERIAEAARRRAVRSALAAASAAGGDALGAAAIPESSSDDGAAAAGPPGGGIRRLRRRSAAELEREALEQDADLPSAAASFADSSRAERPPSRLAEALAAVERREARERAASEAQAAAALAGAEGGLAREAESAAAALQQRPTRGRLHRARAADAALLPDDPDAPPSPPRRQRRGRARAAAADDDDAGDDGAAEDGAAEAAVRDGEAGDGDAEDALGGDVEDAAVNAGGGGNAGAAAKRGRPSARTGASRPAKRRRANDPPATAAASSAGGASARSDSLRIWTVDELRALDIRGGAGGAQTTLRDIAASFLIPQRLKKSEMIQRILEAQSEA